MENEAVIRLSFFLGIFILISTLERFIPKRTLLMPKKRRWMTNWALVILDTLTVKIVAILIPLLAVGAAIDATAEGWGVFNHIALPDWLEFTLIILIFDFAVWLQHWITHKVPLFWKFHRVHHADRDMDVTTAVRFHPVEIAASMLFKIVLVYIIGPTAWSVVMFEVLLNGAALFTHANLRLPNSFDRIARRFIVTPDMHRIHHSVIRSEHDSNYGFALSIWDRLFGTYVAQPADGQEAMIVGLEWQDSAPSRLGWSLSLPFRRP